MNKYNIRDWVVLKDYPNTPLQITHIELNPDYPGEAWYVLHNGYYTRESNLIPYAKPDALSMLEELRDYCNQVIHSECDYSIYNQLIDRVDEIISLLE